MVLDNISKPKQKNLEDKIKNFLDELIVDLVEIDFNYLIKQYDDKSNCFAVSINASKLYNAEKEKEKLVSFEKVTFYIYMNSLIDSINLSVINLRRADDDFKNQLVLINEVNADSVNGYFYIQNNWIKYNSNLMINDIENSITKDHIINEIAMLLISLDRFYLKLANKTNENKNK